MNTTTKANRQKEYAMRNYYYFSHDANAHDDNKLRVILCDYGYAGYGLYWLLIETMRQEPSVSLPSNNVTYKTLRSHSPKDSIDLEAFIDDCVAIGLFEKDSEGRFYSRSLRTRVEQAMEISKKRADAAKASSRIRNRAKGQSDDTQQETSTDGAKAEKNKATKSTSHSHCSETSEIELSEQNDPPFITLPLNDGTEFFVPYEKLQEWKNLYPAVDVAQALRSMRGWLLSNPVKRKTKKGIERFINAWLSKEQDRGGSGYTSTTIASQPQSGNIFADMLSKGEFSSDDNGNS